MKYKHTLFFGRDGFNEGNKTIEGLKDLLRRTDITLLEVLPPSFGVVLLPQIFYYKIEWESLNFYDDKMQEAIIGLSADVRTYRFNHKIIDLNFPSESFA